MPNSFISEVAKEGKRVENSARNSKKSRNSQRQPRGEETPEDSLNQSYLRPPRPGAQGPKLSNQPAFETRSGEGTIRRQTSLEEEMQRHQYTPTATSAPISWSSDQVTPVYSARSRGSPPQPRAPTTASNNNNRLRSTPGDPETSGRAVSALLGTQPTLVSTRTSTGRCSATTSPSTSAR